jgi:hypothetical protein
MKEMTKFDKARQNNKKRVNLRVKIGKYDVIFWALPIFPIFLAVEKIKDWHYNSLVWNEEKATKVLDKVLPKVLEWVEENDAYYYCMDWGNSHMYTKAPLLHKAWARKFSSRLQSYIRDGYENKNYTKEIEKDYYEEWVKFVEIK